MLDTFLCRDLHEVRLWLLAFAFVSTVMAMVSAMAWTPQDIVLFGDGGGRLCGRD